ncbi:hypothetical protein LNKW23_12900 [Paralimibaculum aggregatum]|uniref:Poly(3-hydroxyalkanoate) polymerase subunit PhaE n=1 Tax=Paralimibaculum aggregatum TaxID=3036245 RepID=A0ABQ6LGF7_9RHOB|nr:poly(R)-hydroxyalkanoic acid synthase subunit PhaE [Limibaculum sp. NKW23]GMG82077.1 hypothetical protein LNKW23_12900 [Limibaculum sp. NKW23]
MPGAAHGGDDFRGQARGRAGPGAGAGAGAGEGPGADIFRSWVEAHRALLESGGLAGPVWRQAELLFEAWGRFAENFAEAHAARHGGPGASPFDPAGWLRPEGGGGMSDFMRWLEGPELADLWGEPRAALKGTREWLAWLAADGQMKAVLGEAWIAAFRRFVEGLAGEGGPPGWDAMVARWLAIAEEETARAYRSPAYLAAQRDLIAAETALRAGLRARIETVAELVGLPTRAELDDLHETLHGLRREMRRMKAGRGHP